jgi:hypothetical protein
MFQNAWMLRSIQSTRVKLLSEISLVLKESGADTQQQLKSLEKISIILERFLQE